MTITVGLLTFEHLDLMDLLAMYSPKNNAPLSPIKILAGLKLCGKKPKHTPKAMIAMSGPILG